MSLNNEVNQDLLENVIKLCRSAGDKILEVYESSQPIEVNTKTDDSPVTKADIAAHEVLNTGLLSLLKDVPVLSEESKYPSFEERKKWTRYWLIDPLDGTKEFINRNGEFTVNVALIENNVAILGVVYAPVIKTIYCGIKNLGAWKETGGERKEISARKLKAGEEKITDLAIVASRRHGADEVLTLIERLEKRFAKVEMKSMGSSLKLCLVAEGAADLYPRLALTCEWDTAAAQAVVEAAGAVVYTPALEPLLYNAKDELLNPFFYVIGDPDYPWREILQAG